MSNPIDIVIETFCAVVIDNEQEACDEDPNPHVVALACALGDRPYYATLAADWTTRFGVASEVTPDLVARVVVDALDEGLLGEDAEFIMEVYGLDDLDALAKFSLTCNLDLGARLLTHIEAILDATEPSFAREMVKASKAFGAIAAALGGISPPAPG